MRTCRGKQEVALVVWEQKHPALPHALTLPLPTPSNNDLSKTNNDDPRLRTCRREEEVALVVDEHNLDARLLLLERERLAKNLSQEHESFD